MKQTFGQWLRGKREETGLSQERLAVAVGVDRAYVNKVERGKVNLPNPETRERFHQVLGTSEEDLVRAGIVQGVRQTYLDQSGDPIPWEPPDDDDAPLTPEEREFLSTAIFSGLNSMTPRKLRELIRIMQETE